MIRALSTSATGLGAQQANIERISNDIANINTDGYKRSRNEFDELMYTTAKEPGQVLGANSATPVGIQNGTGVRVGASYKIFEQGPAKMTYHPYDLMIEGNGFFMVDMTNGGRGYTRTGNFKINADGNIVTNDGSLLVPNVTIPADAKTFQVVPNGEIRIVLQGEEEETVLGQIQLASFSNSQGLRAEGSGIYTQSLASGPPLVGVPGENGLGQILAGALEGSNVNVASSMIDMITTQRAYEMNTKVMGVADKMMEATSNIK